MKVCDKTCIFIFFPIINKYFLMAKRSLLSRCPSYYYSDKSKRTRRTGHFARRGEKGSSYVVLVGKPEEKRRLGRPRCRWENIKINPRDVRWEGLGWVQLAQKAGRCEDGSGPSSSIMCVSLTS